MMKKAFLSFSTILLCTALQQCQPFGQRIFYGTIVKNPLSKQKLVVYFNTKELCPDSYALLLQNDGILKLNCEIQTFVGSNQMNNYRAYVHQCRTGNINFQQQFQYKVFGLNDAGSTIAGQFLKVKLADPTNNLRDLKMIFLGDWADIAGQGLDYLPIDQLLLKAQAENEINGLVIVGDIAYNIDTDSGVKYEQFLRLLARTVSSIPIIMIPGNHQHFNTDQQMLVSKSFENYGRDVYNVTGLTFGRLFLVPFDPHAVMFNKVQPSNDLVIKNFKKIFESGQHKGKFVICASHYPYRCSGTDHCLQNNQPLKPFFDTMLDNGVSLYISGHEHQYQRQYPYYKNGSFSKQIKDYKSNEGYLIAIIQGVAGNTQDITKRIQKIEPFTALSSLGQTGIGLLTFSKNIVNYKHYETNNGITDEFQISIPSDMLSQNAQPMKKCELE